MMGNIEQFNATFKEYLRSGVESSDILVDIVISSLNSRAGISLFLNKN
jgi:hypothetical protein